MKNNIESGDKYTLSNVKRESSLRGDFLFFLIIMIIPAILFYVYLKILTIWYIFLIGFFIFLIDFELWIYGLFRILRKKYPSSLIASYDEYNISMSISSILILLFYFLTKSKITAFIFFIFFILGVSFSKLREIKLIAITLTSISLIAFYYAYVNNDIFLYLFSITLFTSGMLGTELRKIKYVSIFLLILSLIIFYNAYKNKDLVLYFFSIFIIAYMSRTISEHLGKNLEDRDLIMNSGFLFIIMLSLNFFSFRFLKNEVIFLIGLLHQLFFGIIFLDQFLRSYLYLFSKSIKKDDPHIAYFSTAIFSLILFSIFFFMTITF